MSLMRFLEDMPQCGHRVLSGPCGGAHTCPLTQTHTPGSLMMITRVLWSKPHDN